MSAEPFHTPYGSSFVEYADFLLYIAAAVVCGALVGIDREVKDKPLGIRTYIIVSVASALWANLTVSLLTDMGSTDGASIDPSRVIQGVTGGIGFLGAGAIISKGNGGHLRGVASGASIWGAGAVGVACGLGYYIEGIIVSLTITSTLLLYGLFTKED